MVTQAQLRGGQITRTQMVKAVEQARQGAITQEAAIKEQQRQTEIERQKQIEAWKNSPEVINAEAEDMATGWVNRKLAGKYIITSSQNASSDRERRIIDLAMQKYQEMLQSDPKMMQRMYEAGSARIGYAGRGAEEIKEFRTTLPTITTSTLSPSRYEMIKSIRAGDIEGVSIKGDRIVTPTGFAGIRGGQVYDVKSGELIVRQEAGTLTKNIPLTESRNIPNVGPLQEGMPIWKLTEYAVTKNLKYTAPLLPPGSDKFLGVLAGGAIKYFAKDIPEFASKYYTKGVEKITSILPETVTIPGGTMDITKNIPTGTLYSTASDIGGRPIFFQPTETIKGAIIPATIIPIRTAARVGLTIGGTYAAYTFPLTAPIAYTSLALGGANLLTTGKARETGIALSSGLTPSKFKTTLRYAPEVLAGGMIILGGLGATTSTIRSFETLIPASKLGVTERQYQILQTKAGITSKEYVEARLTALRTLEKHGATKLEITSFNKEYPLTKMYRDFDITSGKAISGKIGELTYQQKVGSFRIEQQRQIATGEPSFFQPIPSSTIGKGKEILSATQIEKQAESLWQSGAITSIKTKAQAIKYIKESIATQGYIAPIRTQALFRGVEGYESTGSIPFTDISKSIGTKAGWKGFGISYQTSLVTGSPIAKSPYLFSISKRGSAIFAPIKQTKASVQTITTTDWLGARVRTIDYNKLSQIDKDYFKNIGGFAVSKNVKMNTGITLKKGDVVTFMNKPSTISKENIIKHELGHIYTNKYIEQIKDTVTSKQIKNYMLSKYGRDLSKNYGREELTKEYFADLYAKRAAEVQTSPSIYSFKLYKEARPFIVDIQRAKVLNLQSQKTSIENVGTLEFRKYNPIYGTRIKEALIGKKLYEVDFFAVKPSPKIGKITRVENVNEIISAGMPKIKGTREYEVLGDWTTVSKNYRLYKDFLRVGKTKQLVKTKEGLIYYPTPEFPYGQTGGQSFSQAIRSLSEPPITKITGTTAIFETAPLVSVGLKPKITTSSIKGLIEVSKESSALLPKIATFAQLGLGIRQKTILNIQPQLDEKTITILKERTLTTPITTQNLLTTPITTQELGTDLITKIDLKTTLEIPRININEPPPIIPRVPPPILPSSDLYSILKYRKKKKRAIFEALSRRKGKEFSLGTYETQATAESVLGKYLKSTLAASGRIKAEGRVLPFTSLGLKSREFRAGKSDIFKVVQRRGFRLGTGAERLEIKRAKRSKFKVW